MNDNVTKAPIKMKIHNFDPFGLGYLEIGSGGLTLPGRVSSP